MVNMVSAMWIVQAIWLVRWGIQGQNGQFNGESRVDWVQGRYGYCCGDPRVGLVSVVGTLGSIWLRDEDPRAGMVSAVLILEPYGQLGGDYRVSMVSAM